jgi:hypothetical protein
MKHWDTYTYNKSAYKPGKSTETTMHHVITLVQEAVEIVS